MKKQFANKLTGILTGTVVAFVAIPGIAQSITETLVQSGQNIPGSSSITFESFSNATLNDYGDVAFEANLGGIAVVLDGLYRWNDSGVDQIAIRTQQGPAGDGPFNIFGPNLVVNGNGQVMC